MGIKMLRITKTKNLVKVCTETNQIEDGSGNKDVEKDAKKFSTQCDRHPDRLYVLQLHHLVADSKSSDEIILPRFLFPVCHTL